MAASGSPVTVDCASVGGEFEAARPEVGPERHDGDNQGVARKCREMEKRFGEAD